MEKKEKLEIQLNEFSKLETIIKHKTGPLKQRESELKAKTQKYSQEKAIFREYVEQLKQHEIKLKGVINHVLKPTSSLSDFKPFQLLFLKHLSLGNVRVSTSACGIIQF